MVTKLARQKGKKGDFDHRSPEAIASGPESILEQRTNKQAPSGQKRRLVIGSAFPNVIPSALQQRVRHAFDCFPPRLYYHCFQITSAWATK